MAVKFIDKLRHFFHWTWQYKIEWRMVDGNVHEYTIVRRCTKCWKKETVFHWSIFDEYFSKLLLERMKPSLLLNCFNKGHKKTIKFKRYGGMYAEDQTV